MNHLTLADGTLAAPISDSTNISNSSYEWENQYQRSLGEFATTRATPGVTNVACLILEPPPEYQELFTEDIAVETTEVVANIIYSGQEPPPPYQGVVTEGTDAWEIGSFVGDVLYSIQEALPEYHVSRENIEGSETGMTQSVTNRWCSSQGSLSAYQAASAGDNGIISIQGATYNTYTAQDAPPTYEEAVISI